MGCQLYVGNLARATTARDVRAAFVAGGHPPRDVRLVADEDTGRPRGFGFVELAPEDDPALALEHLDGVMLEGRPMSVEGVARPQRTRFVGERLEGDS